MSNKDRACKCRNLSAGEGGRGAEGGDQSMLRCIGDRIGAYTISLSHASREILHRARRGNLQTPGPNVHVVGMPGQCNTLRGCCVNPRVKGFVF